MHAMGPALVEFMDSSAPVFDGEIDLDSCCAVEPENYEASQGHSCEITV
jgi:hypothetical protein